MPDRGNMKLADLRKRLEAFQGKARIGGGDLRGELVATLGATALRETLQGFRESRDPYGTPWASVSRGGKPLIKSGQLRASTTLDVTDTGFQIAIADNIAQFHQFGTHARRRRSASFARARAAARRAGRTPGPGGIRPRPMIPTRAGGLGPIWTASLQRASLAVMRRFSGKAA